MAEEKEWLPGWTTGRCIGQGSFGRVYEIHREEHGVRERAALPQCQVAVPNANGFTYDQWGGEGDVLSSTYSPNFGSVIQQAVVPNG